MSPDTTPEPHVRPDVRAFLDAMAAQPRPAFTREVLAQIRRLPPGAMSSPDLPVGDLGALRDVTMPGPGGEIALRLFDARETRAPGPVVVFFHGGGFVVGGIDTHAALAAEIARGLDLPVVSVDYRLAPEHPWPAPTDDGEAATRWIAENGDAFGRAFTGLILCGDSAGGSLALVTSLALRDRPAALPVLMQIPLYPVTDSRGGHPSRTAFGDGYGLDAAEMALFHAHYAPDVDHRSASPLMADAAGLPPTLLVTAGCDPLRDEGRAYAAHLATAGVAVSYREVPGTIHGFATYRAAIPSARGDLAAILALAAAMLREATAGG